MGSNKIEYGFLKEIGLGSENLGGYINGKWKASGPVISTVNPSNNQVDPPSLSLDMQLLLLFLVFLFRHLINFQ